jgi:DNA excision repair protein ERCC-6
LESKTEAKDRNQIKRGIITPFENEDKDEDEDEEKNEDKDEDKNEDKNEDKDKEKNEDKDKDKNEEKNEDKDKEKDEEKNEDKDKEKDEETLETPENRIRTTEEQYSETDEIQDDGNIAVYNKRIASLNQSDVELSSVMDNIRIPTRIWSSLYNYQKTGIRWLVELHRKRVGGINGDQMGLGKTVQTVAFLAALHSSHLFGDKVLIICPATVMFQWVKE